MNIIMVLALIFFNISIAEDLNQMNISLSFKVPYTLGTHILKANVLKGTFEWSTKDEKILKSEFKLAVSDIEAEDKKLQCHLMESLTLNYETSDFPDSHVCEDNKLPTTGKNAPFYTHITARLKRPLSLTDKEVLIEWEIRGIKLEQLLPAEMKLSDDKKKLSFKTKWIMKRSDFGIIVKKFLFIDASNDVELEMSTELDLTK